MIDLTYKYKILAYEKAKQKANDLRIQLETYKKILIELQPGRNYETRAEILKKLLSIYFYKLDTLKKSTLFKFLSVEVLAVIEIAIDRKNTKILINND